ncbi:hypothetical protein LPJ63_000731 [Coemansia sp. RSA 2711]|nr:hypothetical protein LPJ63_000731 [Coemansia sp. RSA 2711]KAJ2300087.1 hypothetical protein IWW54_006384 [Coemansia sp. RSA 2705]KAJ2306230.1 hypothetical protein IWW52_006262 [Coemansia sp. RSA 2704]KAJ2358404.1 hypothetical protein H4S01_006308 [Coemansia sp. RSA 2610]KAJ2712420.1 hypothetical protein H4R23_006159 [Coemansia sp. Cherry 401B]
MAPAEGTPAAEGNEFSAETAQKLVAQIKYYFSNGNMNHDAYMRKTVGENDGWMPLAALSRFNRVRQLMELPFDEHKFVKGRKRALPAVPESSISRLASTLKAALRAEDDVEINAELSAVRRKSEFVAADDWFERTVHFKGLEYGKETPELIDELTAFFNGLGGERAEYLRLRRNPRTRLFKGNVLVEFASAAQAEAVAQRADLEFDGKKLAPMLLPAYHDEKLEKGDFIPDELRRPGGTYPTYDEWCVATGREPPRAQQPRAEKRKPQDDEEPAPVDPKLLVRFTGAAGDLSFAELKEKLGDVAPVKYVEYTKGEDAGIVRFAEPVADAVLEKTAEGVQLSDTVTLKLEAVDDEAASGFFERARAAAANSRGGRRPGGSRGHGHRGKRGRR